MTCGAWRLRRWRLSVDRHGALAVLIEAAPRGCVHSAVLERWAARAAGGIGRVFAPYESARLRQRVAGLRGVALAARRRRRWRRCWLRGDGCPIRGGGAVPARRAGVAAHSGTLALLASRPRY